MSKSNPKKRSERDDNTEQKQDNQDATLLWEDVKKARNRINSQRTRERERVQIESLESEKTRLSLSNDALRFQNRHFRDAIQQISRVRCIRRESGAIGRTPHTAVSSTLQSTVRQEYPESAVSNRLGLLPASDGRPQIDPRDVLPLPLTVDHRRYDIERLHSGLPGIDPHVASLEDLRRRQEALEMEAAILRRRRAAEMENFRTMTDPMLGMNRPSGVLPPLDVVGLRAHQLRMQEMERAGRAAVSADFMRYSRGLSGLGPSGEQRIADTNNLLEDREHESKETERREGSYHRR